MFYYYDDMVTRGRGLILHPGALGDCILTLKLADYLKSRLGLASIDFFGQIRNISFFPGRTSIDRISDISSASISRLFLPSKDFDPSAEKDLAEKFSFYDWIISFMGEEGSDFEANLAVTACLSSAPEISIIPACPPEDYQGHISRFYLESFFNRKLVSLEAFGIDNPHKYLHQQHESLILANLNDVHAGREMLQSRSVGLKGSERLVVICPGSGGGFKCWHIENFIKASQILSSEGFRPIFLLGYVEQERFTCDDVRRLENAGAVLSGLSIEQAVSLLTHTDIFLGNDSGVTHLAGLMGLPVLAVFGKTDPNRFSPLGGRANITVQPEKSFSEFSEASVEDVCSRLREMLD
ncbi:Lipopolysaccharide core heptosyltransferase RfaQ [Sedimentisphaera cyanobacteriorum]|uniref:Lipopolysaccharide core heptosyltransferase RfaQ n=1 Tax=Sedimentisphaera cyanobacteriorum TaxID=1940790 RepID=A0A1Q2HPM9_9BACT|nr:glycosyltransferase family 9 protein [Sedimentisphaera cyanobacteriorum]AQQ09330.1 Lipopolysaccharide core heptosyltransferase RfaQ [Sedimentisphaera cyanobacteriorum]